MRQEFLNKTKRYVSVLLAAVFLASCGPSVSEEVYPKKEIAETEPDAEETGEESADKAFVPSAVKDITEIKKMRSWLEYFYYNNIFDESIDNETGLISEDAMISFAVSHIMQLEHKGLKFDADTFRLYIPKKMLEDVVMKFFGHKVENHHSLSKHGILYEEENYIIQANAREWPTRLDIIFVMENAPGEYSALLNGNNTEAGEVEHQVTAEFERKDGRYILKKYQMITDKDHFISGNPLDIGTSGDEPGIESSGSFGDSGSVNDGSGEETNSENGQNGEDLNKQENKDNEGSDTSKEAK